VAGWIWTLASWGGVADPHLGTALEAGLEGERLAGIAGDRDLDQDIVGIGLHPAEHFVGLDLAGRQHCLAKAGALGAEPDLILVEVIALGHLEACFHLGCTRHLGREAEGLLGFKQVLFGGMQPR